MRRVLAAAVAATVLFIAGCGDAGEPAAPQAGSSAAYPVTAGGVTLEQRPERIVSLSPTGTEVLFAIGAGPQVVAVDDQSTFPEQAPRSELSGFKPNAEAIAGKRPDLVVVSDDLDKIIDQLTKLRIPVLFAPAAKVLDDSYRQIEQLGALTGHATEATALVTRMRGDIDTIVKGMPARSAPLSYYYELDPTLYSLTSNTFVGSLLKPLGLTNVADAGATQDYPQLSPEALVKADPDLIFLADSKCCKQSAATVKARTGWAAISAVRSGQIVALDDDIASRWGPRVVELVRSVADAVAKVPA